MHAVYDIWCFVCCSPGSTGLMSTPSCRDQACTNISISNEVLSGCRILSHLRLVTLLQDGWAAGGRSFPALPRKPLGAFFSQVASDCLPFSTAFYQSLLKSMGVHILFVFHSIYTYLYLYPFIPWYSAEKHGETWRDSTFCRSESCFVSAVMERLRTRLRPCKGSLGRH